MNERDGAPPDVPPQDAPPHAPLVVANWKLHGSRESLRQWAQDFRREFPAGCGVQAALCPPFVLLREAAELLGGAAMTGAQGLSPHRQGAYTGEVSADMAAEAGCGIAILGHSERRALFGEGDQDIAERALRAAEAGLLPLLCVGESQAERDAGQTEAVVRRQVSALTGHPQAPASLAIAYEPIWAIGSGQAATPEQAEEVCAGIKALCRSHLGREPRTLYGGSTSVDNAPSFAAMPSVDGALVGGASLDGAAFAKLCAAFAPGAPG